jgi:TatD DNase family protein
VLYPTSQHYINIHSHRKPQLEEEFVIRNAFLSSNVASLVQLPYAISAGLHPWHIRNVNTTQLTDMLIEQATLRNVLAIGEIGLDKAIDIPMIDQVKVFEAQFQVARALQKPVILHTVRAYNEMIPYLKKTKVPFIFHGFSGNAQQAKELIKQGAVLSFGKGLWQEKVNEALLNCPADSFLLETDAAPIPIDKIYEEAARIRGVELSYIKLELFNTFARLFK